MTRKNAINRLKSLREHYRKEDGYLSIANVIALDIAIDTLKNLDGDGLWNWNPKTCPRCGTRLKGDVEVDD